MKAMIDRTEPSATMAPFLIWLTSEFGRVVGALHGVQPGASQPENRVGSPQVRQILAQGQTQLAELFCREGEDVPCPIRLPGEIDQIRWWTAAQLSASRHAPDRWTERHSG